MQVEPGKILKGKISGITNFGAFVELDEGVTGLVHISEISSDYVKNINDHLKVGEVVDVKVLPFEDGNKISLSIKQASAQKPNTTQSKGKNQKFDKKERDSKARAPRQKTDFSVQPAEFSWGTSTNEPLSFDDMLNKFKQSSDEKMHDLKKNMDSKRGPAKRGSNSF